MQNMFNLYNKIGHTKRGQKEGVFGGSRKGVFLGFFGVYRSLTMILLIVFNIL